MVSRARAPDLVIYDACVDVHTDDRLGHLALTNAGILGRDEWVIHTAGQAGIPLVGVIGGGYDRALTRLAERHSQLFEAAINSTL